MISARERLRKAEEKTVSIEMKMKEIRTVNRAKWMLIDKLGMDEPAAHRYIEKQAMDTCATRLQTAESIISRYSQRG
jgi:response regulator NasT